MHDNAMFSEKALVNMVELSGKTQEYLTRATRRYYQKTPMQIINEIRINFAKTQLEVTNYLVSDIAFEAGYSDTTLFIKNFKKLTSLRQETIARTSTAPERVYPISFPTGYSHSGRGLARNLNGKITYC